MRGGRNRDIFHSGLCRLHMIISQFKSFAKRKLKEGTFLWKILRLLHKVYRFCIYDIIGKTDYSYEINFWDQFLPTILKEISDSNTWRKIFPEQLMFYINEFKRNKSNRLMLLEVGSGPISMLSWGVEQNLFQATAIDPLAMSYDKIMKKYNYFHNIKPVKGYGESLLKLFSKESFDIIYSSNALDHTASPKKCFKNMYKVVKSGGIIFLEGYVNEANREGYKGLHQYNLIPIDGHLFCYDSKGKSADLTEGLHLKCIYQIIVKAKERACGTLFVGNTDDNWYVIVFRKHS